MMRSMWKIMAALGTLTAAACVGEVGEGGGGDDPTVSASIADPVTACAGVVRLQIATEGIELAEPHEGDLHPGHSHYHVYFHDDSGNPLVAGWDPSVDVRLPASATPGTHELHVVLMQDDHTPVAGVDHAVVEVDVGDAPCIAPTMTDTTTSAGGTVAVNVEVGNFTLEAPGGAPAEGHGHYHLYFHDDSGEPIATGYSAAVLAEIPASATPGDHELHLMLMNNDHSPVADAGHGVVTVTVE